ncbi:hypothetical protein D3C83_186140 [compost metagenome]
MALVGADAADQLEPVHDRHVDVGQDQVELLGGELLERADAVARLGHRNVLDPAERKDDQLPHHRRIFDYQAGELGHEANS